MWEIIKYRLSKIGCFFMIGLIMIAATAVTKSIMGWFNYDETSKEAVSNQVGEYVGKGILGMAVFIGFILMGRQLVQELRGKRSVPPPLPPTPPPLPPGDRHHLDDRFNHGNRDT